MSSVGKAVGRLRLARLPFAATTLRHFLRRGTGMSMRRVRLLVASTVAVALAASLIGNVGLMQAQASKAQVFRRVESTGPRVALTFDDCDHQQAWTRLLNILYSHHVKASFICPGREVVRFPGLAKRTVNQGNAIGSHGWDHRNPKHLSYREIRNRLVRDKTVWRKTTGASPAPYYRPPFGAYNAKTLRAASDTGFTRVILWDVDSYDWKRPGPSQIARRVLSGVRAGSIVEMNVLGQTATALPRILRGLHRKELRPVTLPALFKSGGGG
jgi:peptidoglycan/xylan/chitin deacetylase (PgdA/CDA1 family)